MMRAFATFLRDERGATAIEYGLIVALIFLAITAMLAAVGDKVEVMWQVIHDAAVAVLS
jgi:pilus assembly protein Flp/PilA